MGFGLGNIVDSVFPGVGSVLDSATGGFGSDAAAASKDAAKIQAKSADKALAFTKETRDLARADLAPFKDFGAGQINPLSDILTSQGQYDYLAGNPLFDLMMDKSNQATFANQAARGKLGSGGTLTALQDNFMISALPLLQNQQNQLFNAVNLGQSAAAGQANTALQQGNNLANITTQKGNAIAAGEVGAANAKQQAWNNLLQLGGTIGGAYMGAA